MLRDAALRCKIAVISVTLAVHSARLNPCGIESDSNLLIVSLICRQTCPDDLPIVSRDDVSVGVRGVRPIDNAHLAAITGAGGRLDEFCPADLLITCGRERGDDQIAPVGIDEEAVAVPHQK